MLGDGVNISHLMLPEDLLTFKEYLESDLMGGNIPEFKNDQDEDRT